jgi:hypothetical protein
MVFSCAVLKTSFLDVETTQQLLEINGLTVHADLELLSIDVGRL